jgi:predicted phosphodiesterase
MSAIAVLSDIHGNLPALEAVILDMKELDVDQVIVAGIQYWDLIRSKL